MKLTREELDKIRKAIEDALVEVYEIRTKSDKQLKFFDLAIKKIKEIK